MPREDLSIPDLLPRQEVFDPCNPDTPLKVPDCSHTHGTKCFEYPPRANTEDLPCEEDKGRQY
jgi:hypothetical protein